MIYDQNMQLYKNAESLAERIGEINRLIQVVTDTANTNA
jgi:hypothetical protein